MNIKNNNLKEFVESLNNGTLSIEKIDSFGNDITVECLNEFFELIESQELDLFALKVYTTVYDKQKIKELENNYKKASYINATFAAMWEEEAITSTAEDLSKAMLGFVFFGSDFISRVRKGYQILSYDVSKLNSQVYSLIGLFKQNIDNNNFFRELSQIKTQANDDVIFKSSGEELDSIRKIKDRIEASYLIINNQNLTLEELKSEHPKVNKEDLSFLEDKDLKIFDESEYTLKSEIKMEKESEKSDNIKDENFNPFQNEDLDEFEVLQEDEKGVDIFSPIKSLFKSNKKQEQYIGLNNLRQKNKKGSSIKVTVLLFSAIALTGFLIVAGTKQTKVDSDEPIAEKIIEDKIEEKQIKVNRSGTNKG